VPGSGLVGGELSNCLGGDGSVAVEVGGLVVQAEQRRGGDRDMDGGPVPVLLPERGVGEDAGEHVDQAVRARRWSMDRSSSVVLGDARASSTVFTNTAPSAGSSAHSSAIPSSTGVTATRRSAKASVWRCSAPRGSAAMTARRTLARN